MAENIIIEFVGREVGVQYNAETSEAVLRDKIIACEMGLQVLAAQVIQDRQTEGLPIPAIFIALVEAHTFKELL